MTLTDWQGRSGCCTLVLHCFRFNRRLLRPDAKLRARMPGLRPLWPGQHYPPTCAGVNGRLLLAGVPVHVVAARLGHADPAVTLRVYAHVLREHAAGIGDIFAQAVNGSRQQNR
jgi:integrase